MTTNLTADEAVTKPAFELVVGDHVMGDLLPLGVPGEVIFRRLFERNRSEWMFVAYVQRDGFHDSTTFLADAPIRVRAAEPSRVADPTGLTYTRADDEATGSIAVAVVGLDGPAGDVVLTRPARRVEPHNGGMTDEGLVDETEVPHEVLVERGLIDGDGELTEAGREGLRSAIANSLVDETPAEAAMHFRHWNDETSCGVAIMRLPSGDSWTTVGGHVTCKACLDAMPQAG